MDAKCPCQNCDNHIVFDCSTFERGETRIIECPHCHLATTIFIPPPGVGGQKPSSAPILAPQKSEPQAGLSANAKMLFAAIALLAIAVVFCGETSIGRFSRKVTILPPQSVIRVNGRDYFCRSYTNTPPNIIEFTDIFGTYYRLECYSFQTFQATR